MRDYSAYRNRVTASGSNIQDAYYNETKRKVINDIMSSPTLSYVRLNDSTFPVPVIISDKETFYKRVVLFLPETVINVGDYVHQQDGTTYLATDQEKEPLYPQLYIELCNGVFTLTTEGTKTIIGYDEFERPIYGSTAATTHQIPCVITTKIYSVVDNSPIPLPDGAMIIRMPYNPQHTPKINYQFTHRDGQYKVTTISYEKVINEVGYIEMRLQRET